VKATYSSSSSSPSAYHSRSVGVTAWTSTGAVSSPLLRGVAWPESGRAYAVGDDGAMWLWRRETGLWEKDQAAPIAFDGDLMGIAFDPGDAQRGYAVGRAGALLAYGKTWSQDTLPPGFDQADFTSVAFAGKQALVAQPTDPSIKHWRPGGYLQRISKDPWGNDYQYVFPGTHGQEYDLYSLGADGAPGGEGINADIGNWNISD